MCNDYGFNQFWIACDYFKSKSDVSQCFSLLSSEEGHLHGMRVLITGKTSACWRTVKRGGTAHLRLWNDSLKYVCPLSKRLPMWGQISGSLYAVSRDLQLQAVQQTRWLSARSRRRDSPMKPGTMYHVSNFLYNSKEEVLDIIYSYSHYALYSLDRNCKF